jgi:hypothetical protein
VIAVNNADSGEPVEVSRIDYLKRKINDKEYLYEAVQRIALVLSNEITGVARAERGKSDEQQRKG